MKFIALFLCLLRLQGISREDAITRALIDLDSDSIEIRERAEMDLLKIGEQAIPRLILLVDRGGEVSLRAKGLLRAMDIKAALSIELRAGLLNPERALARGPYHVWTRLLLEAHSRGLGRTSDYEYLFPKALHGSADEKEMAAVLNIYNERGLTGSHEQVVDMLNHDCGEVVICPLSETVYNLIRKKNMVIASDKLKSLLDSGEGRNRYQAAWCLGVLEDRSVVPRLLEIAQCHHRLDSEAAIWALAKMRRTEVIDAIPQLLKSDREHARAAAIYAVRSLCVAFSRVDIRGCVTDKSALVREQAVYASVSPNVMPDSSPILRALLDEQPHVRRAAVYACALRNVKQCAGALRSMLTDERNCRLKPCVMWALGRIGDEQAKVGLAKMAQNGPCQDVLHANMSLCFLGSYRGVAPILESMNRSSECGAVSVLHRVPLLGPTYFSERPTPVQLLCCLNALRNQGGFRRLLVPLSDNVLLSYHDRFGSQVWNSTGITLKWPKRVNVLPTVTLGDGWLYDHLTEVSEKLQSPWIIEQDLIRFVPFPDAVTFWTSWWNKMIEEGRCKE